MENKSALELIREKTKKDLFEKLDKYGRCAVIRCTGFGKTWLLSDVSHYYGKVLYLYPAAIIKTTAIKARQNFDSDEIENEKMLREELAAEDCGAEYKNITFMTYAKLARMTLDEIKAMDDYDLIIMDELHRVGAPLTKKSVLWLMFYKQDAHYIGATATPDRMDAFDVVAEFFNGICTYPYTLHDAIQDGIIKMPYYVYCTYNVDSVKEEVKKFEKKHYSAEVKEVINSRFLEACRIWNMPSIIKKHTQKSVKNKNYMKYIAFFSTIAQMKEKAPIVKKWFQEAYPDHNINITYISSDSKEERDNLKQLEKTKHAKKSIDIIACVDMLNLGYHVNDLTGIVMYRCTSSSTIYIQQLGRALSTGSKDPCIVFDVVDNLHRKAVYYLAMEKSRRRKHKQPTKKERVAAIMEECADEFNSNEKLVLQKFIEDRLEMDEEDAFNRFWSNVNDIKGEDLYATDYVAEYREFIDKAVGETFREENKRAMEEYLRFRTTKCGDDLPKTIADIKKMKDIPPTLATFADWAHTSEENILYWLNPDEKGNIEPSKLVVGIL